MPLYEYECDACGRRFELIQKFSDSPVKKCTVCGGAVRKLLSSPAIHFKGTGWYVTDYANKGKSSEQPTGEGAGKAADGDKKATEATKSKGADTKSAPASESSSSPSTKETAEPASSSSSSAPAKPS